MFHNINLRICEILQSLPSRERGLKFPLQYHLPSRMPGSLPSRERGLKFFRDTLKYFDRRVAPFAGAWIEIFTGRFHGGGNPGSLPSRERGLKYTYVPPLSFLGEVAPFAGAWIEMSVPSLQAHRRSCRSFCGSED